MVKLVAKRRVVVGDIHGELEGFKEILAQAGLTDFGNRWTGGETLLIQTGDVIDRGPASVESVELLRKLQAQAPASGGTVVRLCGNHELMLMQGIYEYANFQGCEVLRQELIDEVAQRKLEAVFTDGNRLYCHAGLRTQWRNKLLNEMNLDVTYSMDKADLLVLSTYVNKIFREETAHGFRGHRLFDSDTGIFWNRGIMGSGEAWRIPQVFGHTPTRRNAFEHAHALKLIDIDAGMCRVYGGYRVYLEITSGGQIVQHSKDEQSGKWITKIIGKETTSGNSLAAITLSV